jgi:hypothetical protein
MTRKVAVRALEITIQEIARIVSEVGEAPSSGAIQQIEVYPQPRPRGVDGGGEGGTA